MARPARVHLSAACGVRPRDAAVLLCGGHWHRWRQNALRHSHASYQCALDRNLEKLTAAMGNSARINRQYYQHPQFPRVAKHWFAIYPPDSGIVVTADSR